MLGQDRIGQARSGLVWSCLVRSGQVRAGLVWSGLVWSGLSWHGLNCKCDIWRWSGNDRPKLGLCQAWLGLAWPQQFKFCLGVV